MPTYHAIQDMMTGEIKTIGKDGTAYSAADVLDATRRAERGDADAVAVIANLDRTGELTDCDPEAWMRAQLHDCPECRAALARGEQPVFGGLDELLAQVASRPSFRRKVAAGRDRWRTRKQRR